MPPGEPASLNTEDEQWKSRLPEEHPLQKKAPTRRLSEMVAPVDQKGPGSLSLRPSEWEAWGVFRDKVCRCLELTTLVLLCHPQQSPSSLKFTASPSR